MVLSYRRLWVLSNTVFERPDGRRSWCGLLILPMPWTDYAYLYSKFGLKGQV